MFARMVRTPAPKAIAILLLGPLLACSDTTKPLPAPAARLLTTIAFEGSELRLQGTGLASAYGAAVRVGDSVLVQRRIDDTTVGIRLPSTPGAAVSEHVLLIANDTTIDLGTVALYGFREHILGPSYSGVPTIMPGPSIVADGDSGLIRYWFASGSLEDLGVAFNRACSWGPGEVDSNTIITSTPTGDSVQVVRLGQPGRVATYTYLGCRARTGFASGKWMYSEKYYDDLVGASGTGPPTQFNSTSTYTYRRSADGKLVVPVGARHWIDTVSIVAYRDTGYAFARRAALGYEESAAFSAGGDTLYVLSSDGWQATVLYRISPAGTVFDSLVLQGAYLDVAADPAAPFLYLVACAELNRVTIPSGGEVLVVDARSMTAAGRLVIPGSWAGPAVFPLQLALDPASRNLFVFASSGIFGTGVTPATVRTGMVRFALPPAAALQ